MVSEWETVPIGECAEIYSGFAFKSQDLGNEGIPVVKIKNVNNKIVDLSETQFYPEHLITSKHNKYFLEDGDVLIAMTGQGSVGRVGRIKIRNNQKVLLNQRVGKFIVKDNLDIGYLYYVTSFDYYEDIFFNAGLGSGQPNLSPDVISQVEIPLPPLPVQKAIAHILGTLDDKIELNRQMNVTLEGMVQALFKSWFVDFDPVIDNILLKNLAKCPSPNLSHGERDLSVPKGPFPIWRSWDEGSIFDGIPDEFAECTEIRRALLAQNQNTEKPDSPINNSTLDSYHSYFPSAFQFTEEMGWIPEGWEVSTIGDEVKRPGSALDIGHYFVGAQSAYFRACPALFL